MTSLRRTALPLLILLSLACGLLHGTDILVPDNPLVTGTVVIGDGTTGTVTANAYVIKPGANVIFQGTAGVDLKTGFWAQAGSSFDARIYVPPPVLTSLGTVTGTIAGGTIVDIHGSNISPATIITFGGVVAPYAGKWYGPIVWVGTHTTQTSGISVSTPPHALGVVDVTATDVGGSSTLSNAFTYALQPPYFSVLSPNSGPIAGGTTVTITGTDLANPSQVNFGGSPATIVSSAFDHVVVTTTSHAASIVGVAMTTANGSYTASSAFTYIAPAPTITSITPVRGAVGGGDTVTILGTNLGSPTAVTFAGNSASVVSSTASQVVVTSPANAAGAADVVVTTTGGSVTSTGGFTYIAAPAITSLTPATGPAAGGTSVSITGANLASPSLVTFGGTSATIVSSAAAQIVVTAPQHLPGTVDVVVTTAGGSATKTGGFVYPAPAPVLTTITPASGSTNGGNTVNIAGSGLSNPTSVMFGNNPATVVSSTATQEVVTAPANTAVGAVNVVVTTAGGSATMTGGYTYTVPPPQPSVAFQVATAQVSENVGTANLVVALSSAATSPVTVSYAVTGGTAKGSVPNADYTLANGTLSFAVGVTSMSIPVTVIDDTVSEDDESVIVSLSQPVGANLGTIISHTLTILDNDVGTPHFTPSGGTYFASPVTGISVTIVPRPAGAAIYYTTAAGTTPPADPVAGTAAQLYSGPITLKQGSIVKAICVVGSGASQQVSAVASMPFTLIDPTTVIHPYPAPSGGSPTSPYCNTIQVATDGVSITMDGNGVAANQVQVLGPQLTYGDVPLAVDRDTTITTAVRAANGTKTSVETVRWGVTKLNGRTVVTDDHVTIRHGDSLLFMVDASFGPWSLDPGTGRGPQLVAAGAKVPTPYPSGGTYEVTAVAADGSLIGSVKVVVVDVPFPSQDIIAAEVGYARAYKVAPLPAGPDENVAYSPADPLLLDVSVATLDYFHQVLTLTPKKRGFPVVLARLGDAVQSIVSWKEVTEFTIEQPDSVGLISTTFSNAGVFFIHPYVPGLQLQFTDPVTAFPTAPILSSNLKNRFDPAFGESVGSYVFNFGGPGGSVTWSLTAYQVGVADPHSTDQNAITNLQVSGGLPKTAQCHTVKLSVTQPGVTEDPSVQYNTRYPSPGYPRPTKLNGGYQLVAPVNSNAPILPGLWRGGDVDVPTTLAVAVTPASPVLIGQMQYSDRLVTKVLQNDLEYQVDYGIIDQHWLRDLAPGGGSSITRTLAFYDGADSPLSPDGDPFELNVLGVGVDLDRDGVVDVGLDSLSAYVDVLPPPGNSPTSVGLSVNGTAGVNPSPGHPAPTVHVTADNTTTPNVFIQISATPSSSLPTGLGEVAVGFDNGVPTVGGPPPLNTYHITASTLVPAPFHIALPGNYSVQFGSLLVNIVATGAGAAPSTPAVGPTSTVPLATWNSVYDTIGAGSTTRTTQIDWRQAADNGMVSAQTSIAYPPYVVGVPSASPVLTRDATDISVLAADQTAIFATGSATATPAVTSGTLGDGTTAFQRLDRLPAFLDTHKDCDITIGYQLGGKLVQAQRIVRLTQGLGAPGAYDRAVEVFPGHGTVTIADSNLFMAIPITRYQGGELAPNVTLFYNSRDDIDCGYGQGWRTNFDMHVYRSGTTLALIDRDSQRILFNAGHVGPVYGKHLAMDLTWKQVQVNTGAVTADWAAGEDYKLVRNDNFIYYFDTAGGLVRVRALNGDELRIARDATGHAQQVTDSYGRTESLVLPHFGSVGGSTYTVSPGSAASWSFTYDSSNNGNLTEATISDPETTGQIALHVKFAYDSTGAITSVQNLTDTGYDTTIAYSPLSITTPLGGKTAYFSANVSGVGYPIEVDALSILSCRSAATSFTAKATDLLGNFDPTTKKRQVDRTFDAIGNLASETVYDTTGHQQVTTWSYTNLIAKNPAIEGANLLCEARAHDVKGLGADGTTTMDLVTSYRYVTANGNTRGHLASATDPSGNVVTSVYDPTVNGDKGFLTGTTDGRGKTVSFSGFTAAGLPQLVTLSTAPLRSVSTVYKAGGYGLVTTETDVQAGYVTRYKYDAMNRRTVVTLPGLSDSTIAYDPFGQVLQTVSNEGDTFTWTYDSLGRRTSELHSATTGAVSDAVTTTYAKSGTTWTATVTRGSTPLAQQVTDFDGRTVSSAVNRTLVNAAPLAVLCTTTYAYDATYGWPTLSTDPVATDAVTAPTLPKSTVYETDLLGGVTAVTTPMGGRTQTTRNGLGWPLTVKDPDGNITTATYWPNGQVRRSINAAGGWVESGYDGNGNLVATTPCYGNPTYLAYDDLGQAISQTDAAGVTITRAIDATNRTIAVGRPSLPDSVVTTTLDPANGMPAQVSNNLVGATILSMYPDGSPHTVTPPNRYPVTRNRDAQLRTSGYASTLNLTSNSAKPVSTAVAYDPHLDAPSKLTGLDQHQVAPVYSTVGEVNEVDDNVTPPLTAVTVPVQKVLSRDKNGNVLKFMRGGVVTVNQTYDFDNRMLSTDNGVQTVPVACSWSYTPGGLVKTSTCQGVATTYGYNLLGQVDLVQMPGGRANVVRDHDILGTELSTFNGTVTTTSTYDPSTRQLLSIGDSNGKLTTWTYDTRGRVYETVSTATGTLATGSKFAYDDLDRVTGITYKDGKSESFTYEPTNEVKTHTDRGGRIFVNTHDKSGQLMATTIQPAGAPAPTTTIAFGLDLPTTTGGVVTTRTVQGTTPSTITTTADVRGRKTSLAMTGAVTANFTYNTDDTPKVHAGITYGYDAYGRVTSVAEGSICTATIGYELASGRQNSVSMSQNGVSRSFTFDATGAVASITQNVGSSPAETWLLARDQLGRISRVYGTAGPTGNSGPDGTIDYTYDESGRLVMEQRAPRDAGTSDPTQLDSTLMQYGYDAINNRTDVVAFANPVVTTETFSGTTVPATLTGITGAWSVTAGVLKVTNAGGSASLAAVAATSVRGPVVTVQVQPATPTTAPTAAGLEVVLPSGTHYQVLWQLSPPSGTFSTQPQGQLVVKETGTSPAVLALSAAVNDSGAAKTLTLILRPDQRLTVRASGTDIAGVLTVDVQAPGAASTSAPVLTEGLLAVGAATFDNLTWQVASTRTVRSSVYNAFNQLATDYEVSTASGVAAIATSYTYDVADRMQKRSRKVGTGAAVDTVYAYDDLDRMTGVTIGGTLQATYGYYADSWMRQIQVAGGINTSWTYDGQHILSQTQVPTAGGTSITTSYVHNGNQALWEHDPTNGLSVYAYDGQGNMRGLVGPLAQAGQTSINGYRRRFSYNAFSGVMGELLGGRDVTTHQPNLTALSGPATAGLRGKRMWFDGGTINLFKSQTRSYAADLGNFVQVDPARAGNNWYSYCGGDPVNREDPNGLRWHHVDGQWKWIPDEGESDVPPMWQPKPSDERISLDEYLSLPHVDSSTVNRLYLNPSEASVLADVIYGSAATPESWTAATEEGSIKRILSSDREKEKELLAQYAADPTSLEADVWNVNAKRAKLSLFMFKSKVFRGYVKILGPTTNLLMVAESLPFLAGSGISAAIRNDVVGSLRILARGGEALTEGQRGQLAQYFARFSTMRREIGEITTKGSRAFNLAFDPAIGKLREGEGRAAVEFEMQFGTGLERSANPAMDFLGKQGRFAGKSLDFVGAELDSAFFKLGGRKGFGASIVDHLEDADFTVLYLRRLTPSQIQEVEQFLTTLNAAQRAKILTLK